MPETIKQSPCESIRKATKVFNKIIINADQILRNFPFDSERTGPLAHQNEFNVPFQWGSLLINSFACQWPSNTDDNVWFYVTMATINDLKVYILFVNHGSSENLFLIPVSIVMEFLKPRDVGLQCGHTEFQEVFINYEPKKCK